MAVAARMVGKQALGGQVSLCTIRHVNAEGSSRRRTIQAPSRAASSVLPLGTRPDCAIAAGKRDDIDPFLIACLKERWTGGCECRMQASRGLSGNAIREAEGASVAVVVARAQQSRSHRQLSVERWRCSQPQLFEIEPCLIFGDAGAAHETVEYLGNAEQCQCRLLVAKHQLPDLRAGRFALQERQHSVGVEDAYISRSPSSARASCRA